VSFVRPKVKSKKAKENPAEREAAGKLEREEGFSYGVINLDNTEVLMS